jgi:hypothetical protein
MFSSLRKGHDERKEPQPPAHEPSTAAATHQHARQGSIQPRSRKKANHSSRSGNIASSSSPSSSPASSSSLSLSFNVQRAAVINFRRLLERLERDVRNAQQGSTEQKEESRSVTQQTLLIKVSGLTCC